MMRTVVLTLALILPTARADDRADELKKMQGTWKVTGQEFDGKKLNKEQVDAVKAVLIMDKDTFTVNFDGKLINTGDLVIDAAKSPKTVDAVIKEGMGKGTTMKGLYKFDGKKWLVIFAQPGRDRPKDFKTEKGSAEVLLIYERVKKK